MNTATMQTAWLRRRGGKTLAAYTYHADGNVERLCIGETLSTTYGYDMDRNLQSIKTMDGTNVSTECSRVRGEIAAYDKFDKAFNIVH